MVTALIVVGMLVLLIVAHELGHFTLAKLFKVRVDEFGVGYPPRAFLVGTWGGTEYTINWLPLGGFVRMFGEDGTEGKPEKGSFGAAPLYAQALILVAGVAANALLAWLLFAGSLMAGLPHEVASDSAKASAARLLVVEVVPGSPADAAGIRAGDYLTGMVDEKGVRATLTPEDVTAYVKDRGGLPLSVGYEREKEALSAELRPAHAIIPEEEGRPAVGVRLALVSESGLSPVEAIQEAGPRTLGAFSMVGGGLWQLLSSAVRGHGSLDDVVGPVGLYGVVGDAAKHGLANILALAGFISVNLTIVNLLPVPALDGGRLVMVAYEAITRRRAPKTLFNALNMLGMALLGIFMLAVTWNDIVRLLA